MRLSRKEWQIIRIALYVGVDYYENLLKAYAHCKTAKDITDKKGVYHVTVRVKSLFRPGVTLATKNDITTDTG